MELFGGGRNNAGSEAAAENKVIQEKQQRQNLAQFSRQQAELDQAAVSGMAGGGGASSRGRGLLTFINRGAGGQGSLG